MTLFFIAADISPVPLAFSAAVKSPGTKNAAIRLLNRSGLWRFVIRELCI